MINNLNALLVIGILFTLPITCYSIEPSELDSIISKAENGDAYYQGVLGDIYRRGEMNEVNYDKAYKWSKLSADKGNPLGLYNLATIYKSGMIVNKDSTIINELYSRSYNPMLELAEKGDHRAQTNLGNLLAFGFGVDANLQEALKWYQKAAEGGDPWAQYILGYRYYYGLGYEKDYDKALEWFTKSSENGISFSQEHLGNIYFNGRGVPKNYNEAVKWFRKAEQIQHNKEIQSTDSSSYVFNRIKYEGDKIIPGLLPPSCFLDITEGSCGEACLWSIINSKKFITTQLEINYDGGFPGRGLHGDELNAPLDKYNYEYVDNLTSSVFKIGLSFFNPLNFFSHTEKYRNFLYNEVIEKLKQGHPFILGVKILPDKHFFWPCDHLILLVGYNEKTNEIIFNDFNVRDRIKAEKLLDKTDGYSIINKYDFLNYLEITNFGSK